ncbi:hypothetical protein F4824DRAFT_217756 [Ustulina deusta]|nr:hypothetical protein F4824DRAFT_217756 [Ustulina deusta]
MASSNILVALTPSYRGLGSLVRLPTSAICVLYLLCQLETVAVLSHFRDGVRELLSGSIRCRKPSSCGVLLLGTESFQKEMPKPTLPPSRDFQGFPASGTVCWLHIPPPAWVGARHLLKDSFLLHSRFSLWAAYSHPSHTQPYPGDMRRLDLQSS